MTVGGKAEAKIYLRNLFGPMPAAELAKFAAPVTTYTKADKQAFALRLVKPAAPTSALPFEATDAFLQSYQWRKARMQALITHGARCQCCGASPATGAVMNVDHIKPRKTHPELALEQSNLQVLCNECNHGKGNWSQADWRGRA